MDRALSNGRGCNVACSSEGEAYSLRQRIYTVRKLDRDASQRIFEPDDPRYGRSVYDALIVYPAMNDRGEIVCTIEVSSAERLEERVEDL
jgi:predicted nucleic acid-binding protein